MPTLVGKADRVLVDPPCSALGTRPKLYDETKFEHVLGLAKYQRQFLKVAARLCKPGGVIVYSTCTLTLEENEENVAYAVEELGLEVEEVKWHVGGPAIEVKDCVRGCWRFEPDEHGTPGYFIAKLRKP